MFSLCIPTMNRYDNFLSKYLPKYLSNELIGEIVITDETGADVEKIRRDFPNETKLKLHVNAERLGPFLNKITACSKAVNEWIVLMDSDNFADMHYFIIGQDYIEKHIGNQKNVILAPCYAKPNFNYNHLAGKIFKRGEFQYLKTHHSPVTVLMNTGNYIINKFLIDNLDLSGEKDNIPMSSACDVIYFNTLLFEQLDLHLHVVPGMDYDHVVHDGSIYIQTHAKYANFNNLVHKRFDKLQ